MFLTNSTSVSSSCDLFYYWWVINIINIDHRLTRGGAVWFTWYNCWLFGTLSGGLIFAPVESHWFTVWFHTDKKYHVGYKNTHWNELIWFGSSIWIWLHPIARPGRLLCVFHLPVKEKCFHTSLSCFGFFSVFDTKVEKLQSHLLTWYCYCSITFRWKLAKQEKIRPKEEILDVQFVLNKHTLLSHPLR